MNLEILLAIVAAITFGIADFWSAIPARKLPATTVVVYQTLTLFCIYWLLMLFWNQTLPAISLQQAIIIFLGGLFIITAIWSIFKSLSLGKVGVVAPIFNADALVVLLLSAVFFNEILSGYQYALIVVIIASIFLLSVNFKDIKKFSFFDPGIGYALLAAVTFALASVCYKLLTNEMSAFHTIVFVNFAAVVIMLLTVKNRKQVFSISNVGTKNLLHIFGVSVCVIVGIFATVYAFSLGGFSLVAVVAGASPLVSILMARFILKERLTTTQYTAALLVVVSIMLLAL